MTNQQRFFAYGTFREGGSDHALLGSAPILDEDSKLFGGRLYDLGPYPAAKPLPKAEAGQPAEESKDNEPIHGELYEISDDILKKLDAHEDHPYLYQRKQEDIVTSGGKTVKAWVYWYKHSTEHAKIVANGDYKPFL